MNQIEYGEVFQALDSFILLKRQNLVIYSWILFKKILKKASMQSSRSRSLYSDAVHSRYNRVFAPNQHSYSNQILTSDVNNNSTPNIIRSNKRIATENVNNQLENDREVNKNMPSNRYTLTQKPAYEQLNYAMHTENEEIEDSQEFEDIVLDRLSKLQENINKMMREKRKNDQKRGYVGMPISNPLQNRTPKQHFHSSFDNEYMDVDKKFNNIIERRKAFFQALQKNPVEDQRNVIYNLKYIPVVKDVQKTNDPRVNIQKIRKTIQVNHEQQNFLENVDYFIGSNLPRKSREETRNQNMLERILGRREPFQNYETGRHVQKENGSKQHLSSQLYMNRYKAPNTTRNNFVHYVPNHIEMQTVIQPRKKYFNRTNPLESPVYKYQFENSNASSKVSQVSNYSRKRNNLSALY